jgi:protein-tyrosine-phosphatase
MYKDIEFICSGNYARSPLAEAIARRYLEQRGLKSINVSSSGTLVEAFRIYNENNVVNFLLPLIPKALEREIITPEQAEDIRQKRDVRTLQDELNKKLKEREDYQKKIVLGEMDLIAYFDFNRIPKQTIVRPEAELIIPVDQENCKRTIQIYSKAEQKPRIELLGEVMDPIFCSLDEYRITARELEKATVGAMQKYL